MGEIALLIFAIGVSIALISASFTLVYYVVIGDGEKTRKRRKEK